MQSENRKSTELDDLDSEESGPPTDFVSFVRDARLFARDPSLKDRVSEERQIMILAPDELLRPPVPADVAVRLGKLRVSEFLPDGREVTRAVLQAGAVLYTRKIGAESPDLEKRENVVSYDLARIVIMALDDAELWILPAGALDLQAS